MDTNKQVDGPAPNGIEGTPASTSRDPSVFPGKTGVPSTPDPFDGGCPADAGGQTPPTELPTFKRLDTTMRTMPDVLGGTGSMAQMDWRAVNDGVAAADMAHGINPSGSTAGRNALADAITTGGAA